MSLCTIRAFLSHSTDDFSNWFWRHPPLFSVLMMPLHPFKSGFAERVEIMAIVIGLFNLLLLFQLNRKIFGTATAIWSVFFLAVQPGSVFFDVWIKTDHTVVTFGLLAILLLSYRQPLYSGLCLGLAMLSKETGIFYVIAVFLLWLSGVSGKCTLKNFFALTVIPFLACGWWYFIIKPTADLITMAEAGTYTADPWYIKLFGGFADYVIFSFGTQTGWNKPWNFYLSSTPMIIGVPGIILSFVGTLFLGYLFTNKFKVEKSENQETNNNILWPVLLLVPSYILLSILKSKVPWIVISLLPAWATLQGLAISRFLSLLKMIKANDGPKLTGILHVFILVIVIITFVMSACRQDYECMLQQIDAGQWRGAFYSREAARQMNQLVQPGERVLITSFHYWKGLGIGHACPVFAYYFSNNIEVLLRPHERLFPELEKDIRKYRIDWALLSPEPGRMEQEIYSGFAGKYKLMPRIQEKFMIFKTTSIYQQKTDH
ncbi:MAG: glycosyltransferase family 39 protein [Kiritimatiellae bacterium]|nr:glycosyltransferase family 39 protein [Kiritimatiellia bacterium]